MYIPKDNQEKDWNQLSDFMKANPFALLISNNQDGLPQATHIPLELIENAKGEPVLHGHLAKANKQWEDFLNPKQVLAVFSAPHAYISPSWYTQANVPTWNYIAVHVYGNVRLLNEEETRTALARLTAKYEGNRPKGVTMDMLEEKSVKNDLRALVAFEMTLETIQGKYKLSQNRDDQSYKNIINELNKSSDLQEVAVATEMQKRRPI